MDIETVVASRRAALCDADLSRNSSVKFALNNVHECGGRGLVIADSSIEDSALLLDQLEPGTDLWCVDAQSDFAVIFHHALSGGYGAIHFLGHGREGAITLGGRVLRVEDFTALSYSKEGLKAASLHFWSCMTGAGLKGRAFVDGIAQAFGAAVTAFSGLVGAEGQGGSWLADVFSGQGGYVPSPFVNALAYQHTLVALPAALELKLVGTETGMDVQVWLKAGTVIDAADLTLHYDVTKADYAGNIANADLTGWFWFVNEETPGNVVIGGMSTAVTPINSDVDLLLETISFTSSSGSDGFSVELTSDSTLSNDNIDVSLGMLPVISYEFSVDNAIVDMAENHVEGEIDGADADASDADGGAVVFSLGSDTTLFCIDPSTGQISLTSDGASAIDFDSETQSYTLIVQATDGATWVDERSITVNLTNVNDNPPVLTVEHESVDLAENASSGEISGAKASAEDADGDTVTFSLLDVPTNDGSEPLFCIDPSSGQISLTDAGAAAIDYESSTKSYTLTVKASDGLADHDQTTTVTVNLTNVNDNAPVLTVEHESVDLAENASSGEISGAKASAEDADGDTVAFSLLDVPTNDGSEPLFCIDPSSGQISLTDAGAAAIDYESSTKSYTLTVKACDGLADHDQTTTVTVNLTNVNDNPPVFTSGSIGSVDQDAPTGTVIYEAVTTDADNLEERTYTLCGTDAELLNITIEGVVTLKEPANYATHVSYSFDVVAYDGDNETMQAVVISVNRPDVVTNTDDSGRGSLRAALQYTNANGMDGDSNTITFAVSGVITVDPENPLPVITRPVSFDMGENSVEVRLDGAPVVDGIAIPALCADHQIEFSIPANLTITSEGSSNVIAVGSSGDLVIGEMAGTLNAVAVLSGEDSSEAVGMGAGADIHIHGDLSGTVAVEARDRAVGLGAADNDLQIFGNVSGTVTVTAFAGEAYGIIAADHLTVEGEVADSASIEVTGSQIAVGIGGMGGDLDIYGGVAGKVTVTASEGAACGMGSETSNVHIGVFSGELEVAGNIFAGGIVAGLIPDAGKLPEDDYGNVKIDGDLSGSVTAIASGGDAYGIYAGTNGAFADIPEGTVSGTIVVTGEVSGTVSATSTGTDPENPDAEFNAFGMYAYHDLTLGTMSGMVTASAVQGDAGGIKSEKGDLTVNGDLTGEVTVSTSKGTAYGVEADNDILIKGSVSGSVTSTSDAGEVYGIVAQNNLTIEGEVANAALIEVTGSESVVGFGAVNGSLSITGAMAGAVTVTAGAEAYGIWGGQYIGIGSLSGTVSAYSENSMAFGLRSNGEISAITPAARMAAQPLAISGTVSADGSNYTSAISAGGAMNLSISGTVSGTTTELNGTAYSILSLHYDGGTSFSSPDVSDQITVTGTGKLVGNVDLGAGDDIMTLQDGADVSDVAQLDGGEGTDRLALSGSVALDMSVLSSKVRNFEIIDLSDGVNNQISLSPSEVGQITDSSRVLYIQGDSLDRVELLFAHYEGSTDRDTFQYQENLNIDGIEYAHYTGEYVVGQISKSIIDPFALISVIDLYIQSGMEVTEYLPWVQYGTDSDDILVGTWDDDSLYGYGGNDSITGMDGNDLLDGGTGNDTMQGGAGDDSLDGGDGVDSMDGGAGDDTYVVDSVSDVVTDSAGTDTVESSITYTLGANIENLTLTGTAAINGTGNDLANIIIGNSGNNTLEGGVGSDTMQGGAGNDTYVVGSAGDIVTENLDEGTDTVQSSVTVMLGANIENLTLTGSALIDGTGNDLANILIGNSGNNTLDGGAGDDTLQGGAGNDTYIVDSTSDVVTELASAGSDTVKSSVTWTLGSNVENLTLTGTGAINGAGNDLDNLITGNTGNNNLSGGLGNDTIDGGGGNDTMLGGLGNDTYIVDSASNVVTEVASAGTDTVQSLVSYTLGSNIENLTLTGTAGINGTGNTLANLLTGNDGSNILDGGVGNDTMQGGLGNDTYVVDSVSDVLTEAASAGTDMVQSLVSYTLGANIENLTLAGSAAINGTGNDLDNLVTGNTGNNSLSGGLGNDTLDGGAGNDTMQGGLGNDTYMVNSASDVATESASAGTDTVQSSLTWTLGANIENLTLTGTTAINGTGNTLANILTGNDGNNILDGGAGNDTMQGGLGNDTYVVNSVSDVVTEAASAGTDTVQSSVTYTLGANIENLTLTGTAAINGTGNDLDNLVTGNTGNNNLSGGLGNDTLNGAAGNDTMQGGAGNDTYMVDSSSDVVTELASAGTDTVQSSVTYTLAANIENLTLTGSGAINGTGNTLDNLLVGNSANNILNGGVGSDAMQGGLGNDTYVLDSVGDVVTEAALAGTDMVQSNVTYTLGDNIENLTLTGSGAINGTGNALANLLVGNGGNNTLDGGAGNDTMQGGLGNDTYVVNSASDVVTEAASAGTDTVQSNVTYTLGANIENLTLTGTTAINGTGNTLANILAGNDGNNILDGGAGNDTMQGGLGNDTYVVNSASDVVTEAASAGTDTVQSSIVYMLGANFENLTLTGTVAINGTGNDLANLLIGNSGNNILDGGAGNDTMQGGLGNDTYVVDSISDVITEAASAGTDTVQSSVTWTLGANIENLALLGIADINGTGNALVNSIIGNSGNNILDGGAGRDTMQGGGGSDLYLVGLATDHAAAEFADSGVSGTDEVRFTSTTASTLTLYAGDTGIESVVIGTGTGATANTAGTTALNVNASAVTNALSLTGNDGANTLTGTSKNDMLSGGGGNDSLQGGAGDDTLIGGNGNDSLTGGTGSDHFVFDFTPNATTNKDTITDFVSGTDELQFRQAIFAGLGAPGELSAAAFLSSPTAVAALDLDDRIIYNTATGALYYDADGLGGAAAMQIAIIGTSTHPALAYIDIHVIA